VFARPQPPVALSWKSPKVTKEVLNLVGKGGRLLHCRKMIALLYLRPVLDVCIGFSATERGGTALAEMVAYAAAARLN